MLENISRNGSLNAGVSHRPSIQAGRLEVRFAASADELSAAQELRYKTLYIEAGGAPSEDMTARSPWSHAGRRGEHHASWM